MNICSYSVDDYMRLAKSFHGSIAPGLLVGGYMVDLAVKQMDEGILFDAISETSSCLPDAIQLLTPCTTGNGWLRIMDFGRFALSIYNKESGEGVRVTLNYRSLDEWGEIKTWFFRLKPKREQDTAALRDQIIEANYDLLSLNKIVIRKDFLPQKKNKGTIKICAGCGEPYKGNEDKLCGACQGINPLQIFQYYEI
jgi:formylmethanofuran dehydrogenase subunit E